MRHWFACHCTALVFRNAFDMSEGEALELALVCGGGALDVQGLRQLWVLSECAVNEQRRLAHTSQPKVAVAVELLARKRSLASASVAIAEPSLIDSPTAAPLDGRWPKSLRRCKGLLGDPDARAKAEQVRRNKWLGTLQELVAASPVPLASIACKSL